MPGRCPGWSDSSLGANSTILQKYYIGGKQRSLPNIFKNSLQINIDQSKFKTKLAKSHKTQTRFFFGWGNFWDQTTINYCTDKISQMLSLIMVFHNKLCDSRFSMVRAIWNTSQQLTRISSQVCFAVCLANSEKAPVSQDPSLFTSFRFSGIW